MKTENIKNEINNIRKHKLGLTSINTNQDIALARI